MSASAQAATELVRRAKAGDRRAYGELVRRYRSRIVALALHLSGSAAEAEDIAQDVFMRAYQKLDGFEGRSHFFTWIYRMAVNRALNSKRTKKRRRETDMEDERIDFALAIDSGGDPERAASLRQTYKRLLRSLDGLPATMRTSVVLVTLQGMSHDEAAVIQQCSPGTVAWRLHEARKRLRKSLMREHRRADGNRLSGDFVRLLSGLGMPIAAPAR
jgi:RNA polymerase sigma-70 factor (ECF subfamily)